MRAVDEAVAAKLMVPVILAEKSIAIEERDSLEEAMEDIFGEDRTEACRRVIRACGSNRV